MAIDPWPFEAAIADMGKMDLWRVNFVEEIHGRICHGDLPCLCSKGGGSRCCGGREEGAAVAREPYQ